MKIQSKITLGKRNSGFTLVELMITVTVIGILAAIAYPSYGSYARKARRTDAKAALLDLATRQERFFSTRNTYTAAATDLGYATAFPVSILSSGTAYYQINVSAATSTAFTATATPIGLQATDACKTYQINQLGVQSISSDATASTAECW